MEHPALPEAAKNLTKDPFAWQLATELSDPVGNLITRPRLRPRFAAFILDTFGVEFSSQELVASLACNAVEAGMDADVITDRAKIYGHEALVVGAVEGVVARADKQADEIIDTIAEINPERSTLVAVDYIARKAYEGKDRRSGKPYYTHPQEAAAMVLHVLTRLETEGYTMAQHFKDALLAGALLHDATEETNPSCKYFDPSRPHGFTPLLVRKVFDKTGNPYGRQMANTLRLMTHYAKHPWAPTYDRYISLGSSDFMFCVIKASDIWHNLHVDPKPAANRRERKKIADKQTLYEQSLQLLSNNAAWRADGSDEKLWARRYFDILRTIEPADMPDLVSELNTYIYGNSPTVAEHPATRDTGPLFTNVAKVVP